MPSVALMTRSKHKLSPEPPTLISTSPTQVWPGDDFTLSKLLQQNILEKLPTLQDISDGASREYALERQLDGMQAEWAGVEFELIAYGRLNGFILKGQVSSRSAVVFKAGLGLRGCDSSQAFRLGGEEADFELVADGRLGQFILKGQVSSRV